MPEPAAKQVLAGSDASGAAGATGAERDVARAPAIAYWMFNFEPRWEAASMELAMLAASFRSTYGVRTITLDFKRRSFELSGRNRHLPALLGVAALPWLLRTARATPVNHIFASASERVLTPRLARLPNTILTITKGSRTLGAVYRSAGVLRALRYVVVESERHRDVLLQLGVAPERIRLIHPGLDPEPYRPAPGPFTILFATSPKTPEYLLTRGIYLLLGAAASLPEVRFRLIWRWSPGHVQALVRERRLGNVEVLTGYRRDMKALYDAAHAVVLPGLEYDSFKPCPHSALHALAHGKPLLVSRCVSLAGLVERHRCGIVFEPNVEALRDAVPRLAGRYADYQANTVPTLLGEFSQAGFLERYGRLYASLLSA